MVSKVHAYEVINARLSEYYTDTEIDCWWNLPHPKLGNLVPITVSSNESGPDRINEILDRLDASAYL